MCIVIVNYLINFVICICEITNRSINKIKMNIIDRLFNWDWSDDVKQDYTATEPPVKVAIDLFNRYYEVQSNRVPHQEKVQVAYDSCIIAIDFAEHPISQYWYEVMDHLDKILSHA